MINNKEAPQGKAAAAPAKSQEEEHKEALAAMTEEQREEHEELMELLDSAVGSYCEIRGMDNILVLIGYLERVEEERGAITVRSADRDMQRVIFNTPFKLMIRPRGGMALVLNGTICGSTTDIWKLDHLVRYFYKESRGFFRQPTDTVCFATCINELYYPVPEEEQQLIKRAYECRVMDVSLQGIQLRGKEEFFAEGDWLLLTDLILVPQQRRYHNFLCQVRRNAPAGRGETLFGCQFQYLTDHQQDTLCSDIFVLHRLDIQNCRI